MYRKLVSLVLFVAVLCVATTAGAAGSLVAHWALDGDVQDSSPNNNHGTQNGGVTYAPGMSGQAVQLDADAAYLQVPNNPGIQLRSGTGFTVAAYVNTPDTTHGNILIHGLGCSTWASWFLGVQGGEPDAALSADDFVFGTRSAGGSAYTGVTAAAVVDEWVHVAATHDGTTLRLYLNGEEQDSADAPIPFDSQEDLYFGGDPGCGGRSWYSGLIDEVYIFSRSMSASQLQDLTAGILPVWLKAERPDPPDGAAGVTQSLLQWGAGDGALFHNVYLGASPDLTEADLVGAHLPFTMYYHVMGLDPGVTYYWRVDEIQADMVTITTGDVWSFTMVPLTAWAATPADGAQRVQLTPTLGWTPGQAATQHHLYFGGDFDAVKDGAAETDMGSLPVATTTYEIAGPLDVDTTYYWRVDETAFGGELRTGEVWSFTTHGERAGVEAEYFGGVALAGAPILSQIEPQIDHQWGSGEVAAGLSDLVSARWRANLEVPLTETYTLITTSDDGVRLWFDGRLVIENWTDHGPVDDIATFDLVAGQYYMIQMEYYESGGGAVAELSWESDTVARQIIPQGWLQLPLWATNPWPVHLDPHADQAAILTWNAGDDATGHDVYFGDDAETVAAADTTTAGIYRGRQAADATSYNPGPREWGKTYYWRVDEVNPDGVLTGALWSFTAADFLIVDDFEAYDDADNRIYLTWIDGVDNGTTSYVGYPVASNGTFGETVIVYSGWQSMPLDVNNVNTPYYGETSKTFVPALDMTVNGMDTLTLYVRGQGTNDPIPLYVGLKSGATRVNVLVPDAAIAQATSWQEVNIPLADFAPVNAAAVNEMFISLGNPDAPTPDGAALIFVDAIRATKAP